MISLNPNFFTAKKKQKKLDQKQNLINDNKHAYNMNCIRTRKVLRCIGSDCFLFLFLLIILKFYYILKDITTDDKLSLYIMDRDINYSLNIVYLSKIVESQQKEAMRN